MNKLLVSSAITALLVSSAAQAEIVMETGDVSVGYSFGTDTVSGAGLLDLTIRGDYAIGQLGVQLDGFTGTLLGDPAEDLAIYAVGGHAYMQFNNGVKAGAYVGYDSLSIPGDTVTITNYGVEAMAGFGSIDLEASLGWIDVNDQPTDPLLVVEVNASYDISPSFELSAGYENISGSGNNSNIYTIGAGYTLSNMPVSIDASYTYFDDIGVNGIGVVGVNVSYSFGGPSDEQLFNTHGYPFKIFASGNL